MAAPSPERSVLLIGVPDAGKTNFLSRLWLALDKGNGLLAKGGLPSDLEYLRDGADHLLRGEFAPHTPQDVHNKTEIPVRSTAPGSEFVGTLVVPDVPGEQVLAAYENRSWSSEWEERIGPGCGCLLFVRVDSKELITPLDWVTAFARFGGVPKRAKTSKEADEEMKPPTQVVMVEWLQFLGRAFSAHSPESHRPRVGVVVSAWDRVPHDHQGGPGAWVAEALPLLHQFVEANDDEFEFAYFGVSVVSGDLVADKDFKKTYLKGDPWAAGSVVHALSGVEVTSHDMTLPVAWALGVAVESDPGRP